MTTPPASPSLASRLQGVVVSVRADLEISRHVFRDQPCYIVRDPITFQSHRIAPEDYDILIAVSDERTLGETFEQLVQEGRLDASHEDDYYQFLLSLHQLGVLNLPVANDKILYQRFERRQRMERRSKIMGVLFMRVPMFNPDAFLNRTMHYVRPLFTKTFFCIWLLLMAAGGAVIVGRWGDLQAPLLSLLSAENILLTWVSLIGLKVIHEFGHAYACKNFGGHVPEMGAFFVIFTPCAYVDATAAWGFTNRRDRIIVSLAGMYFESVIAVLALFVWAATGPSMLNAFAYQVFLLAGVVTVGFNLNPLMRYDGYYVASDVLDVPNLRAKAQEQLRIVFDRYGLGLPAVEREFSRAMTLVLVGFGVASVLYKVVLVVTMCGVIAMKVFLLGLVMAIAYLVMTLTGAAMKAARYLWWSPHTAPVRRRAVLVSALLLTTVPAFVAFVPVARPIQAAGEVRTRSQSVVRAQTAGFVTHLTARPGGRLSAGDVVARMENEDLEREALEAEAQVTALDLQIIEASVSDRAAAITAGHRRTWHADRAADARVRQAGLNLSVERAGVVLSSPFETAVGRFVQPGEEIATIGHGPWIAHLLLDAEDLADASPEVGDMIECRPSAAPGTVLRARITEIAPAGSRAIEQTSLTHFGGGSIAVDAEGGEAAQPYFTITVLFENAVNADLRQGMTVTARFDANRHTVAMHTYRRVLRFLDHLRTSS